LGTLEKRPVRIDEEGRLFGPGAIDMKGGITVVLSALRGLKALNRMPDRPIWVLMTTDEEVGSVYSAPIIKEQCVQTGLVLVMEPATIDEALKTQRKGIATYRMDIEGLPSHAGNAPEKGINAITELAQQVLKVNTFNDLRRGVSVNVTMVEGGSATNVIPGRVGFSLEFRSSSDDKRKAAIELIKRDAQRMGVRRKLEFVFEPFHETSTTACTPFMQNLFADAISALGYEPSRLPSGAGHDAQVMAKLCPTAMLFVRCKGGISHNPAEFASETDIGLSIAALVRFIEAFAKKGMA
jgi:allantoate deiminase